MFSFIKKLFSPFTKIKSLLGQKILSLFSKKIDETTFLALEQLLYEADLGPALALELTEKLKTHMRKDPNPENIIPFLKSELLPSFISPPPITDHHPHIILIVGVNGSGKTTSIAKLASHYKSLNKNVLIAAADTFRAAAVEQLSTWAQKIDIDIIKSKPNSDPSSVVFDALSAAKARNSDIVLIDTAGRLQTKTDLMQELSKIRRTCQKQIPDSPHETLLVLDATIGQNALDQAKIFHQFTPITGIILTKLDGSSKAGIAIPIQRELKIPILWVGLGEKEADLIPFNASDYLDALLKPSE